MDQRRDNLEQISNDTIIGNFKYRCVGGLS